MNTKERKYNRGDELLKKLVKGIITPDEKIELQQMAEEDPFLKDALDGLNLPGSHQENIQLIKNKFSLPKTRSLNYWISRAAILLLFISGSVWIFNAIRSPDEQLAQVATGSKKETTYESTNDKPTNDYFAFKTEEKITEDESQSSIADPDLVIADEVFAENRINPQAVPHEEPTSSPATSTGQKEPIEASQDFSDLELTEVRQAPPQQKAEYPQTKQRVLKDTLPQHEMDDLVRVLNTEEAKTESDTNIEIPPRSISGRIMDTQGEPLIGAVIQLQGTEEGTISDLDGNFRMDLSNNKGVLEIINTGFNSIEVPISSLEKVNEFILNEEMLLEEVMVLSETTGPLPKTKNKITQAHPKGGFKKFKKYLEENKVYSNAVITNNIHGDIVINFTIQEDGSLKDFKIIESLGYGLDQEAIRLLKEGPNWVTKPKNVNAPGVYRIQF